MISYNIIVGDTLTKVFIYFSSMRADAETMEVQREAVVLVATLFVTLPLSLYRDVARMSRVSFLSLVSIAFIMLSILIRLGDSNL
jgi:sodium-coupled neutral amino acid transporter 11